MENNIISEKEFKESYLDIEQSINFLKELKEKVPENWFIPNELSVHRINVYIKDLEERRDIIIKQYACPHTNTTGMTCVGSDSHNDHYENRCKDCNLVLKSN